MGWKELYGLANRTDFDLGHQEYSGEDLRYFDQETGTRFLPYVIEPTFGVDRTIRSCCSMPTTRKRPSTSTEKPDTRSSFGSLPAGAVQGRDFPLMKKPELTEVARPLFQAIQNETDFVVDYDETANRQALSTAGRGRHAVLLHLWITNRSTINA